MDRRVQWALVILLTVTLAYAAYATRYYYPPGQQELRWRVDRWTGRTQTHVCLKTRPARPGDPSYDALKPYYEEQERQRERGRNPRPPGQLPGLFELSETNVAARVNDRLKKLTECIVEGWGTYP